MIYTYHYDSPLGSITMAGSETALTGLWFDGQKYFGSSLSAGEYEEQMISVFEQAIDWLDTYFSGENPGFLPALSIETTPFRKAVWEILLGIPYGKTMTYGEIADRIAKERGLCTMSAQAVGGAVGHNPFTLMIPCHRVVGAKGSLTGYAGGIERKLRLLELEKADLSSFSIPRR
ncbi:MAG: methylated-DNA--[protein]-cysteine S-methyltransferase [Emergencia sp.]|nr:methylated-DNA--[protein]-cysteine S-methyltransferase [Emergencia sp.]